jgi:lipoyl(octanoyl) transferase
LNCTKDPIKDTVSLNLSEKWLGTVPYSIGLELQHNFLEQIESHHHPGIILGMEHPSVITLGKRAEASEEIKVSMDSLDALDIQCYKIDRGGHATLHSPGQLVIYPIFKLADYGLTVKDYLCLLQKSTIEFFKEYGISCYAKDDFPGIYTENGKIAFFGIRVKKGTTYHGLSINVENDTENFSLIRSCGVQSETFDRMKNYGVQSSLEELFLLWVKFFRKKFGN